jgi:hypothetical protein
MTARARHVGRDEDALATAWHSLYSLIIGTVVALKMTMRA